MVLIFQEGDLCVEFFELSLLGLAVVFEHANLVSKLVSFTLSPLLSLVNVELCSFELHVVLLLQTDFLLESFLQSRTFRL